MDIEHAPLLSYDPWCVVLSCLEDTDWVAVAGVSPSLDAVVVYLARELGAQPDSIANLRECGVDLLRVHLRWGTQLRPISTAALVAALYPLCTTPQACASPSLAVDVRLGAGALSWSGDDFQRFVRCTRGIGSLHLSFHIQPRLDLETADCDSNAYAMARSLVRNPDVQSVLHALHWGLHSTNPPEPLTDDDIACCTELRVLRVGSIESITSVNSLQNLTELDASVHCGIDDAGIAHARRLRVLHAGGNPKITTVGHCVHLGDVRASTQCGIGNTELGNLPHLTSLNVSYNMHLRSVNHLRSLRKLTACGYCGIDSDGIKDLRELRLLNVTHNRSVTCVNGLSSLEDLRAGGSCGLDDAGIAGLSNLRVLDASGNMAITSVRSFPKLEELSAAGRCGIDDRGLAEATRLRVLDVSGNPRVTTVAHMPLLEKLTSTGPLITRRLRTDPGTMRLRRVPTKR